MARRLRSALDASIARVSPRVATHLKLWRRSGRLEREADRRAAWSGSAGVDYREMEQVERIRGWERYADLFSTLRRDDELNLGTSGGPVRNPWYATPDAEVYAAMIGDLRPRTIVEIGAGFSTRVARHAVDELGLRCSITVVDPRPRSDVTAVADHVVSQPIQQIDPGELPLEGRTLLFVDSSHVALPGGDVPYVYGRIIPRLPAGASVHAHDVFLPFDYPPNARRRLYNEQYLLHALLSSSGRYRVLFATYLMSSRHPDELGRAIGADCRAMGGSFWFGVVADA